MGLIILMSVCAAYVLVDVLSMAQRLNKAFKTMWFNRKPFNCKTCMSGWMALILLIRDGYSFLNILFLMCVAMVASIFLNEVIFKL